MTSKFSLEFTRFFKSENNGGCGIKNEGCNTPTLATKDTPRWEWEQIYGKLVTYFALRSDKNGHSYQLVERIPCSLNTKKTYESSCCSVKYKVIR